MSRCVRKVNADNMSEVSEYICDRRTKPREVNYCLIPCPGHCVVGVWSEWTDCAQVGHIVYYIELCRTRGHGTFRYLIVGTMVLSL